MDPRFLLCHHAGCQRNARMAAKHSQDLRNTDRDGPYMDPDSIQLLPFGNLYLPVNPAIHH